MAEKFSIPNEKKRLSLSDIIDEEGSIEGMVDRVILTPFELDYAGLMAVHTIMSRKRSLTHNINDYAVEFSVYGAYFAHLIEDSGCKYAAESVRSALSQINSKRVEGVPYSDMQKFIDEQLKLYFSGIDNRSLPKVNGALEKTAGDFNTAIKEGESHLDMGRLSYNDSVDFFCAWSQYSCCFKNDIKKALPRYKENLSFRGFLKTAHIV